MFSTSYTFTRASIVHYIVSPRQSSHPSAGERDSRGRGVSPAAFETPTSTLRRSRALTAFGPPISFVRSHLAPNTIGTSYTLAEYIAYHSTIPTNSIACIGLQKLMTKVTTYSTVRGRLKFSTRNSARGAAVVSLSFLRVIKFSKSL